MHVVHPIENNWIYVFENYMFFDQSACLLIVMCAKVSRWRQRLMGVDENLFAGNVMGVKMSGEAVSRQDF